MRCNKLANMLTYCNADAFRGRPLRGRCNVGANPTIGLGYRNYYNPNYHVIIYL